MDAYAQARAWPVPSAGDSRIQTAIWHRDEMVHVRVGSATPLTMQFGQDEHIINVTMADARPWAVTVARDAGSLTVRFLPNAVMTNMIVRTDRRTYLLELEPNEAFAAVMLRFSVVANTSPPAQSPSPFSPQAQFLPQLRAASAQAALQRYRVKGDKALQPDSIADDGQRTYIRWSEDKALPAVFAVDETGREMTIDGFMRDGAYTIDRVWPELVFRIDRHKAVAVRLTTPKPTAGENANGR
ncbi:TrbG/VirB9 family P-type conjugative transfer protein [Novosphingobium sp. B-7]|uniref:TrbG/VirB9 family P-type conjugative transfer protein n=1 Tax=Novosphingobium sp. B-7 TaxID=1298855 RepID=UPI0003B323BF|nr:TrbG/VirB9 family P-type conjugative transfer protein [Novosphingobium sp. B-7]